MTGLTAGSQPESENTTKIDLKYKNKWITAVATKIRPYIYRVNNLKIIHLKKWLVVLKRTD